MGDTNLALGLFFGVVCKHSVTPQYMHYLLQIFSKLKHTIENTF